MLGVLHVVDSTTPRDCLAQLRLLFGAGDTLVSIGPPPALLGDGRRAPLPVKAVHCPMGLARLGGMALRPFAVKASVVHAWSGFSASAGAVAAGRQELPLLLSLPCLPTAREIRSLRIELPRDRIAVTVPTDSARGVLVSAGIEASAVHVLRPAFEPVRPRDQARRAMGLDDGQFAVVALGEMTRQGGHKNAAWVQAILLPLAPEFRLILPGGGRCLSRVRRFVRASALDETVTFTYDQTPMPDVLAAADVAVLLCERACGLSDLAGAMSASVPVVASRIPDIAECTDGGAAGLLVEPGNPRQASAAVLRLRQEPGLAGDLGARGRTFARGAFDPAAVRRRLEGIYSTIKARRT